MKQSKYSFCSTILAAGIGLSLILGGLVGCHRIKEPTAEEMRDRAFGLIEEGQTREKAGDFKQAIDIYQQALALSPRPAVLYSLGHCYAQTGDYGRAEEYLNKALLMQPEYTEATYELQRVMDLRGQNVAVAPIPAKDDKSFADRADKAAVRTKVVAEAKVNKSVAKEDTETEPSLELASQAEATADMGAGDASAASEASDAGLPVKKASVSENKIALNGSKRVPDEAELRIKPTPRPRVQIKEEGKATPTVEPTPAPEPRGSATPTEAPALNAEPTTISPELVTTPLPETTPVQHQKTGKPDKTDKESVEAPGFGEIHEALFPGPDSSKKRKNGDAGLFADDPTTRSAAGQIGYQGGEAIALNTYPYHLDKAKGLLQIKEYDKAINELEKALTLKPNDPEALLAMGDAYASSRRDQAAMNQFQAAIRSNPKDARAYFKIGNLYSKDRSAESQQAARKAYEDAITMDPNYRSAYYNLGVLAMQSHNTDEAISYLEKVTQMDSNHVNAHLYLGILYGDYRHDDTKARVHYQRYLDLRGSRSAEVKKWMKALDSKDK